MMSRRIAKMNLRYPPWGPQRLDGSAVGPNELTCAQPLFEDRCRVADRRSRP